MPISIPKNKNFVSYPATRQWEMIGQSPFETGSIYEIFAGNPPVMWWDIKAHDTALGYNSLPHPGGKNFTQVGDSHGCFMVLGRCLWRQTNGTFEELYSLAHHKKVWVAQSALITMCREIDPKAPRAVKIC